ncbi:hypothetical protein HAX54_026932 [Datura stramonium]|uniref:Uncharacterized protein n=1 Tax=Datura stramonium TaxID=4076 RepID=A0ABS8S892_DATST|nr:hypothetical protein [Datura stramonium]
MIKQILNKLPRKLSKSVENHDETSNASTSSMISDLSSSWSGNSSATYLLGVTSSLVIGLNNGAVSTKANGTVSPYEALPSFRDVPNSDKQNLFLKKLNFCCVLFDFTDPTKDLKEKTSSDRP